MLYFDLIVILPCRGGGKETHPEYAAHNKHKSENFSIVTSWATAAADAAVAAAVATGTSTADDIGSVSITDQSLWDTATSTAADATADDIDSICESPGGTKLSAGARDSMMRRASTAREYRRGSASGTTDVIDESLENVEEASV